MSCRGATHTIHSSSFTLGLENALFLNEKGSSGGEDEIWTDQAEDPWDGLEEGREEAGSLGLQDREQKQINDG